MKNLKKLMLVALLFAVSGCSSVTTNSDDSNTNTPKADKEWLIPQDEVVNGGVAKEGIPSIDDPGFLPTTEIDYVDDDRLIIGVRVGDTIKGYPHQIMDHHEIVNDKIDQRPYSLTYCPLTGTGIAWDRTIDGETIEFGVSGLLFRNNLIPFDRKTDTNYSQMQMRGVNGPRSGEKLETLQVIQTTWSTWKKMFPNAKVLSDKTGFRRNYDQFLYGEEYLEENSEPLFPLTVEPKALGGIGAKERVYGIIEKNADIETAVVETYVIDNFGNGVHLKERFVGGADYIIVGSSDWDFATGFEKKLSDGTELSLEPVQNSLPIILKDQEGNRWDIFGYAVEGPRKGERLVPAKAYYGYWFAWVEFFFAK